MAQASKRVLVTGGAGFIGSHLVDGLLQQGYEVRVYDNLDPQVHGPERQKPAYLNPAAEFVLGDMRDRAALHAAVRGVHVIYHQAAAVGVAQSMYEVLRYTEVNSLGGATLLDILANEIHTVEKVIVASSMTSYGEGQYHCHEHGTVYPKLRPNHQLEQRDWEVRCPLCAAPVTPQPTDEDKPLHPASVYAINKREQEEMFLSVGRTYQIPTVALRYFNAYGPRQALSNPYTGVAAIFSGRLLNGKAPLIYEDGLQSRDFVHVSDIVQANLLALEADAANYETFNVGSGRAVTVLDVAEALAEHLQVDIPPILVGKYRASDIRHCHADITKIQRALGYAPQVRFEDGVAVLIDWVRRQTATDRVDAAAHELERRGLAR